MVQCRGKMEKPDFCCMHSSAHHIASALRKAFLQHGGVFSEQADELMPFKRPTPDDAETQGIRLRHASVALPVFPIKGKWHIALMKRTEYAGVHSGQISIPGGEVEPEDADRKDTAMREFEEEMGVDLRQSFVVEGLSERFIPPSRFVVKAFVAVLDREPQWKVHAQEVDSVLIIPIASFFAPDSLHSRPIEMKSGVIVSLPAYYWNGETIWGATAIILTEFVLAWKDAVEGA